MGLIRGLYHRVINSWQFFKPRAYDQMLFVRVLHQVNVLQFLFEGILVLHVYTFYFNL